MNRSIFAFAVATVIASIANAQVKTESSPRLDAPDGFLQSLPAGPDVNPKQPDDNDSRNAGFGWYNNCQVNGSSRLLGSEGATQISVYARDVDWRYAFNGPEVNSPSGTGGPAGSGWRFPNANRFGIVIYKGNNYWNVTSTSSSNPTVITGISNTTPVYITINDTTGNYSDNGGAVDIYLRKDN